MQNKFQFPFHMDFHAIHFMLAICVMKFVVSLPLGFWRQEKNIRVKWLHSITNSHHHFYILMSHHIIIAIQKSIDMFWRNDLDLNDIISQFSFFLYPFPFLLLFSSSNGNMWFCNNPLSCAGPSLYVYTWESFVAIGPSRLVLHILATERSCPFFVSYGQHLANCCSGISTVSHGNIADIDVFYFYFFEARTVSGVLDTQNITLKDEFFIFSLSYTDNRYIYVCHAPLARIFLTMPKVRRSIVYIFLAACIHQSTRFFDT